VKNIQTNGPSLQCQNGRSHHGSISSFSDHSTPNGNLKPSGHEKSLNRNQLSGSAQNIPGEKNSKGVLIHLLLQLNHQTQKKPSLLKS